MHRRKFDSVLKSVSSVFRTLAHPDRIRLLGLLAQGEMDVTHLHQALGVSQSVASQHLRLLKLQGLVAERKESTRVFYRLSSPAVCELIRQAVELQSADLSREAQSLALLGEMRDMLRPASPAVTSARRQRKR